MQHLTVRDLMSSDVITLNPDETLDVAEQVMKMGRVHHLPVVAHGRLVGVVTESDLLRAQTSNLADIAPQEELQIKRSIAVSEVMTRDVCTVSPDAPAVKAARMLQRHRFGGLPVVEGTKLVGIITEGDFLQLLIHALTPEAPRPQLVVAN